MLRRFSVVAALAAAVALLVAVAPAGATSYHHEDWDVFIAGTQTVTWSFDAESPEQCTSYYGTASTSAKGSGKVKMSFATPKKRPLSVETSSFGHNLRFAWESLGEHRIPATWSKHGIFSTTIGKPCGSSDDDPEPLPKFADDSGCGRKNAELNVYASWKAGSLVVQGAVEGIAESDATCPGVFEEAMHVDAENDRCTPSSRIDGTDGTELQELHNSLPQAKFIAGKTFTVDAHHEYDCDFPAAIWPGSPVLKADLVTTYEVTFKPRTR